MVASKGVLLGDYELIMFQLLLSIPSVMILWRIGSLLVGVAESDQRSDPGDFFRLDNR